MNHTFEVILAILIMILFLYPFLYYNYEVNDSQKKLELFNFYYNYIEEHNLRDCLVKENCQIDWIRSYNCSTNKQIKLPENYLSFYIIGNEEKYCPTLVIVNLSKKIKDN